MKRTHFLIPFLAIPLLGACTDSSPKPTEIGDAVTITAPPTTEPKKAKNALDVVNGFKAKGLPVAEVVDYNATTDPNTLLGRPHGYTSKVNFHDSRLPADDTGTGPEVGSGGSVEWYDNDEDAKARYDYLDKMTQSLGGIIGHDYMYLHGKAFTRVSSKLTPDQAAAYDTTP